MKTSLLYNEYQAMERFGLAETDYYLLPRDVRARKVAYVMIDGWVSVFRAWESSLKGRK